MNKNDYIKYAAIAGGAYLVYWYVTNYGPNGAVSAGAESYWNTWFGVATVPTGMNTAPVPTQQPAQATVIQPSAAVAVAPTGNTQLRTAMLQASSGNTAITGGYAIPDVWSYYFQQVSGRAITSAQLSAMFPPGANGTGAPLTIDQFLAALPSQGLAGVGSIVSTPASNSLPSSMSFGGALRRGPGMQGMGGRGFRGPGMGGGSTIQ